MCSNHYSSVIPSLVISPNMQEYDMVNQYKVLDIIGHVS